MPPFKVSVITVVFNARDVLDNTIASVMEQDYENIEYVIVDGASTDGTINVIEKNRRFIGKLISEPDNGIYDAMNKGVKLASGDYVIFMNAGDKFFSPSSISECAINFGKGDIIYGDHWVLGSRRSDGLHHAQPIEKLKYGMICSHQSMFFKRDVLLSSPFSLNYGTAGDYECICRLYRLGANFIYSNHSIVSFYSAGGVSDMARSLSVKDSFLASKDNFDVTFLMKVQYFKKMAYSKLVDFYVSCFIKK